MAQIRIRIIFEGHFIPIFKYSNIRAHHCCTRWRRHTDGHGDSQTNLAQRGRFGENPKRSTFFLRMVFLSQHYHHRNAIIPSLSIFLLPFISWVPPSPPPTTPCSFLLLLQFLLCLYPDGLLRPQTFYIHY